MDLNNNTALLVMDVQVGILGNVPYVEKFLEKVAKVIKKARDKNIQVIYVTVGFRKGTPEISPDNKAFAPYKEKLAHVNEEDFTAIHHTVKPADGEIIIRKRRFSAFTGSDLEVILRANNIKQLILTGCSTSGVVLSTTREAADKDYKITIISDACADADEEVHQVLMNKIFLRQAAVITVDEWGLL